MDTPVSSGILLPSIKAPGAQVEPGPLPSHASKPANNTLPDAETTPASTLDTAVAAHYQTFERLPTVGANDIARGAQSRGNTIEPADRHGAVNRRQATARIGGRLRTDGLLRCTRI